MAICWYDRPVNGSIPARRKDHRRGFPVEKPRPPVERRRLPRGQSFTGEVGKGRRVARRRERVPRDERGFLVLAVAVPRRAREDRPDDLRPEAADDADGVPHDLFARPEPEGLLDALGVPEVVPSREVLPRAVEPPRRVQLLRADHPQARPQLLADQVLSAVAARQRQVGRLSPHAARHERQERRVLVVRVRRDDEDPPVRRQLGQHRVEEGEPSRRGRGQRCSGRVDGERAARRQARRRREKE